MPELIQSEKLEGPHDEVVKIRFYDDKSIRFQVNDAGPMAISEAFLSPGKGRFIIIKLIPQSK